MSYGRFLHPNLSAGASLKFVWRNLQAGSGSGYGIDLGVLYIPSPGLTAGLTVRNLPRTRITFDSGADDRVSPSLLMGLAYKRPIASLRGTLLGSLSARLGGDKSGEDSGQTLQAGLEYVYSNRLAFRMGIEGQHFAAGTGLRFHRHFGLDLAFLENGQLDNTYRISAYIFF